MSAEAIILKLLHPTSTALGVPTQDEWRAVELQLGTRLPEDYKHFMETFGTGKIDEFLVLLTPCEGYRNIHIVSCGNRVMDAYRASKSQFPQYYRDEVYPSPGGILPFALTDNGNVLYWRTIGSPEQWTTTVYEERGPRHFEFEGSMSDFLAATLTGAVKCDELPRDFPRSPAEFRPLEPR